MCTQNTRILYYNTLARVTFINAHPSAINGFRSWVGRRRWKSVIVLFIIIIILNYFVLQNKLYPTRKMTTRFLSLSPSHTLSHTRSLYLPLHSKCIHTYYNNVAISYALCSYTTPRPMMILSTGSSARH